MKIFVTGTRGIPDIPGGVEKHCQELYPLVRALGHEVVIATRTPYVVEQKGDWNKVKLFHIYTPRNKSLEAIVHTFLAILKARLINPDIIHIHSIGPGLLVPFARLLGLKVVVTNHGPDYERQKWGKVAKMMLKLGEYLGGKFANEVIVISTVIGDIVRTRCRREANLIYNGVTFLDKSKNTDFLDQLGIKPKKYILAVARFVPEKGLHDLIEAFREIGGEYQLVIAGDADHETIYSCKLKKIAGEDERIILPGFITGKDLNQVYSFARLFCLPSYHEGLPIVLLEAMSYGLPVLVSNIPANKKVDLPDERFFKRGDVADLRKKLQLLLYRELTGEEQLDFHIQIIKHYNWLKIAEQTVAVYEKVVVLNHNTNKHK